MPRPCSNPSASKRVQLLATVLSALSCERRIELVELLCKGELSEKEIGAALQMSQATVSHHLHALRLARLVNMRREANWRLYFLKHKQVCHILASAGELLKEEFRSEGRTP